jgi:poly(3-hydroxybutyrate) depolymerase
MLMAVGDAGLRPGDHTRTVSLKGVHRSYLVHVPPQYDPATPMPVVLAFHGGGANADNMVVFSGLNEKADQAGFIVVYPAGSGRLQRMLTLMPATAAAMRPPAMSMTWRSPGPCSTTLPK